MSARAGVAIVPIVPVYKVVKRVLFKKKTWELIKLSHSENQPIRCYVI